MHRDRITDKVTIVTGASSGIGRATALALAKQGAKVVLSARNVAALQLIAGRIEAVGGQALVAACDVPQQGQVQHLVEQTLSCWGRVDILIANAGQYIRAPVAELTLQDFEKSMAVNFYGGMNAILAVLPHMLAQRSGHIVLVTSMDAFTPIPPDAPYVAAKCAMTGFGEVLRQELRGTGVFTSTILPGRVDTPMLEGLKFHWLSAKITPEKVAQAILKAIRRRQARVILPPQAVLLRYFNVFSPSLFDWAVRIFRLEGWKAD